MANVIKKHKICLENITQGGAICSNPKITWDAPECVTVPCIEGTCIDVEILEGCGEACITVIVDCDDCDECPPQIRKICFCEDGTDCPECNSCVDGICVDTCPDEICDQGNCVKCTNDDECPCDQKCLDGSCVCDPSTPYKGIDECCYECLDSAQCDPCFECIGGKCVSKDCGTGFCNPDTGECGECTNNEQCTGPNECCINGNCGCCPGFERDPVTGLCIVKPQCRENSDCADCKDCIEGKCVDRQCPECQTCVDDDCVQSCCGDCGDCADGYGCINCVCVPCAAMTCDGSGLDCDLSAGCECENGNCIPSECNLDETSLIWKKEQGTPGNTINPGTPAPNPTSSMSPLGIVSFNGAQYQDFQFNFGTTTGESGSWTLDSGEGLISLGSGTSVSFKLSDYTPPNVFGFIVNFQGSGSSAGANLSFDVYPNFDANFIDTTLWNIDTFPSGTPGSTTGGTPSVWTLCSTNGNFDIQSIMKDESNSSGAIEITLGGIHPSGCRIATISGCGIWNGTAILECGGATYTKLVPEFSISEDNCCDPTEDDCPTGTGNPCTTPSIESIILREVSSLGGSNEYGIKADWQSAGFSRFSEWMRLTKCWSVDGGVSLLTGVSSPFGGSSGVSVKVSGTGCVYLGHSCDMIRPGCKKLQGEYCFEDCDPNIPCSGEFTVSIIGDSPYKAYASDSVGTTYTWTLNGGVISTGQTAVPTSSGVLIVEARNGDCKCTDQVNLTIENSGCTDPNACNFDSKANIDNGSCVVFTTDPMYDCSSGLILPSTKDNIVSVSFKIDGISVTNTTPLDSNQTYILDVFIGNVKSCSIPFTTPRCWDCITGDCQEVVKTNSGWNESTCGGTNCATELIINSSFDCSPNDSRIIAQTIVDGGSGSYSVTFKTTGGIILAGPMDAQANVMVSAASCIQNVIVEAVDKNDSTVKGSDAINVADSQTCCDCAENASTIKIDSISQQAGTVAFTFDTDLCSTEYTVRMFDQVTKDTIGEQSYTIPNPTAPSIYTRSLTTGASIPTGTYYLRLYPQGFCALNDPSGDVCFAQSNSESVNSGSNETCLSEGGLAYAVFGTFDTNQPIISNPFTLFDYRGIDINLLGTIFRHKIYRSNIQSGSDLICNSITTPADVYALPIPVDTIDKVVTTYIGATSPPYFIKTDFDINIPLTLNINESVCIAWTIEDILNPGVCLMVGTYSYTNDGTIPGITITNSSLVTTGTGNVLNSNSWNSENIQGDDLYIIVTQSDGVTAACGDPTIFSGPIPLNGDLSIDVEPSSTNDTILTVWISDNPAFDPCNPTGTYDTQTVPVPQCTCDVAIDEVSYSSSQQEIYVRGNASCFTDLANLQYEFNLMTDSTCTVVDIADIIPPVVGFTQSQADGSSGVFAAFPDTPDAQYIQVIISDNATGGCSSTVCLEIPSCGSTCGVQTATTISSRFQNLIDVNGKFYHLVGVYALECDSISIPNDTFADALQLELRDQDSCANTSLLVDVSQVPGSGESSDCLTNEVVYTDGGTGTLDLVYEGITINGTLYAASIIYGSYVAGIPNVLSTTVAGEISDHIRDSLDIEGAIYSQIVINVQSNDANIIQFNVQIRQIITTTATFHTNNTDVPAVVDTVMAANCNLPTDQGGGIGSKAGSTSDSTLGCVQITITGSTIEFSSITIGVDVSTFSGC